ncbi:hypothetical protein Scep_015047 [Stephania cephalantha]|uniref:Uncharacterized protein n=1 Tax=Stephania cephalantha TaxID=152367 RepID=A0AAP0J2B4_9MAGN
MEIPMVAVSSEGNNSSGSQGERSRDEAMRQSATLGGNEMRLKRMGEDRVLMICHDMEEVLPEPFLVESEIPTTELLRDEVEIKEEASEDPPGEEEQGIESLVDGDEDQDEEGDIYFSNSGVEEYGQVSGYDQNPDLTMDEDELREEGANET